MVRDGAGWFSSSSQCVSSSCQGQSAAADVPSMACAHPSSLPVFISNIKTRMKPLCESLLLHHTRDALGMCSPVLEAAGDNKFLSLHAL